ncbi:Xre family transcriptional regulator [Klebsiella pneumoniae]|nr:Xre family transcriptional regulator [Klebsiella pneumoniae]
MTIQYIKDEEGKDQYVVIPYSDYFRMRSTTTRMKATGKIFLMNQISMMTSCCRAKSAT